MKYIILIFLFFSGINIFAQEKQNDSTVCEAFFTKALSDKWAIENLEQLVTKYPYRLCGSKNAENAINWAETKCKELATDTIFRQNVKVLHWQRDKSEYAKIFSQIIGNKYISVCTIGGSVGTGEKGISAKVIEVKYFEDLKKLGSDKIKGNIIFFNREMDSKFYYTFQAYGGAANQRTRGASEAAKYGAVAVIVRSLTLSIDTFTHTGVLHYDTCCNKIPAFCISTFHANLLSNSLKKDSNLTIFLKSNSIMLQEENSCNLIAEIKGTEHKNEYITIGGHIDSWDNTQGAHDDGAGIIHTLSVLKLFKDLNIKPKHTIRFVMFIDEEMDQRGAKKYLEMAIKNNEKHIAAIESDRGGSTPLGFSTDANDTVFNKLQSWKNIFINYGIYQFIKGGSGVDIGPLKKINVPLFAIMPDSQRYFDYHHCANDTFDKVNHRELQLGSASIALLVYLIDKYGL